MFDFLRRWKAECRGLAVNPAGDRAVVGTASADWDFGEAIIVSLPKGRVIRRWQPYGREPVAVAGVAWSPCGRWIVTSGWWMRRAVPGGGDPKVKVWDADSGKQVRELGNDSYPGDNLAFSADGRRLLTRGGKLLHIWDFESGEQIARSGLDGNLMLSASISPDGGLVAIGGWPCPDNDPCSLRLFEVSTGKMSRVRDCTQIIWKVLFTPDGRHVLTTGEEGGMWEIGSGRKATDFGSPRYADALAVSEDQKYMAMGCGSVPDELAPMVWVASTETGQWVAQYAHKRAVSGVAFLGGGMGIVAVDKSRQVRLWPMPGAGSAL